jgi:hypothetical protein
MEDRMGQTSDLLRLPETNTSGGKPHKEYFVYNRRKYLVHTGSAKGRYIIVKENKKY